MHKQKQQSQLVHPYLEEIRRACKQFQWFTQEQCSIIIIYHPHSALLSAVRSNAESHLGQEEEIKALFSQGN